MSDSNTPHDETSSSGQNPRPGAWLPPRLREKLETPDDTPDDWTPKSSSPVPAIVTTALVLIVFAGGFIWWRSASQKKSGHATATAQADATSNTGGPGAATAAPATDSLAATDSTMAQRADTLASTASTTSAEASKPAATTPRPTASTPPPATPTPATGASSAAAARATANTTPAFKPKSTREPSGSGATAAPRPSAGSGFGIVVGSYLFEDRANGELSRLEGVTGLSGMVTTSTEGGNTTYNVVLGRFGNRAAAERKAAALVDSNQVRQAQVIARSR